MKIKAQRGGGGGSDKTTTSSTFIVSKSDTNNDKESKLKGQHDVSTAHNRGVPFERCCRFSNYDYSYFNNDTSTKTRKLITSADVSSFFFMPPGPFSWTFPKKSSIFFVKRQVVLYGSCLAARRSKLVGGICSMLPYGTSICCYAYISHLIFFYCFCPFLFLILKKKIWYW